MTQNSSYNSLLNCDASNSHNEPLKDDDSYPEDYDRVRNIHFDTSVMVVNIPLIERDHQQQQQERENAIRAFKKRCITNNTSNNNGIPHPLDLHPGNFFVPTTSFSILPTRDSSSSLSCSNSDCDGNGNNTIGREISFENIFSLPDVEPERLVI